MLKVTIIQSLLKWPELKKIEESMKGACAKNFPHSRKNREFWQIFSCLVEIAFRIRGTERIRGTNRNEFDYPARYESVLWLKLDPFVLWHHHDLSIAGVRIPRRYSISAPLPHCYAMHRLHTNDLHIPVLGLTRGYPDRFPKSASRVWLSRFAF